LSWQTNLLQQNSENDRSCKVYNYGMNSDDLYRTHHKAKYCAADIPTRTQLKELVLQWTIHPSKYKVICYSLKEITTQNLSFSQKVLLITDWTQVSFQRYQSPWPWWVNSDRTIYSVLIVRSFVCQCIHNIFTYVTLSTLSIQLQLLLY
jgi:hypothetical protein